MNLPKRPLCCNRPAIRETVRYSFEPHPPIPGQPTETSFRCSVCGRIRIPYVIKGLAEAMAAHMAGLEAMRVAAVAEDERLFGAYEGVAT